MNTQTCDFSQLSHKEISYQDLLQAAFDPATPDAYALYLQEVLKNTRNSAIETGWAIEAFSFVLNPQNGKITVWG